MMRGGEATTSFELTALETLKEGVNNLAMSNERALKH